jgi:large subunit ribosomal protein L17
MCRSLFIFEKIRTTVPKAKEARRLAEHIIEFAKKNDLAAKRAIYRYIPDHKLVKIICEEIAPNFANRQGGYTRIYRLGPRLGDGAEIAILELVEQNEQSVINTRRKLIERRALHEEKPKEKGKKAKSEKSKEPKTKKPKKKLKEKPVKKERKKTQKKTAKKRAKKEKKAKKRVKARKKKTKKKRK